MTCELPYSALSTCICIVRSLVPQEHSQHYCLQFKHNIDHPTQVQSSEIRVQSDSRNQVYLTFVQLKKPSNDKCNMQTTLINQHCLEPHKIIQEKISRKINKTDISLQ